MTCEADKGSVRSTDCRYTTTHRLEQLARLATLSLVPHNFSEDKSKLSRGAAQLFDDVIFGITMVMSKWLTSSGNDVTVL